MRSVEVPPGSGLPAGVQGTATGVSGSDYSFKSMVASHCQRMLHQANYSVHCSCDLVLYFSSSRTPSSSRYASMRMLVIVMLRSRHVMLPVSTSDSC